MSYDLFVALPDSRIIRKTELDTYYKAETARPNASRAKSASELPAALQKILSALQEKWPSAKENGSGKSAGYALSKSSFLASFPDEDAAAAHELTRDLTFAHSALFHDPAKGGWLNAMAPPNAAIGPAFTCERCILRFVTVEDLRELLSPDWFADGRFFCIAPGEAHFVQVLDHGGKFYIEYRAAPGRPVFRSVKEEIGSVAALLQGYLAGQDMNTPEYAFHTLVAPPDFDAGLPVRRDQQGRWMPH